VLAAGTRCRNRRLAASGKRINNLTLPARLHMFAGRALTGASRLPGKTLENRRAASALKIDRFILATWRRVLAGRTLMRDAAPGKRIQRLAGLARLLMLVRGTLLRTRWLTWSSALLAAAGSARGEDLAQGLALYAIAGHGRRLVALLRRWRLAI
jgi:hypothetical protein